MYSSNFDNETILFEINLRKKKWLLNGFHNPNKSQIIHHLECLNILLDEHSKKYENNVFIGDFNVITSDSSMKEFCSLNRLKNLINEPTCYKNSEKTNLHWFDTYKSTYVISKWCCSRDWALWLSFTHSYQI